jgi:pimeloyl-ACP methyl ester carboxylesterase
LLSQEYPKVIVIGRSLGTGIATHVAMKYPISAVCLISAYKSFTQIFLDKLPIGGEILSNYFGF